MHQCLASCPDPIIYLSSATELFIRKLQSWRDQNGVSVYYSLNYGDNFYLILEENSLPYVNEWLEKQEEVIDYANLYVAGTQ
jgi:mevalonate pyrophosphate decarboxylase